MHQKRWYVLVGILVLLGLAVSALNSPWLVESAIAQMLSSKKGLLVRRVHIDRQHFTLPGRLELQKVDVVFEMNAQRCTLELPQVVITGLQSLWSADRRFLISAPNITARYAAGSAKQLKAELTLAHDGLSGPLTAFEVGWDKLRTKNVSAFLIVNPSGVELRALKFEAYGGKVSGKVFVSILPGREDHTYAAELLSDGVDVVQLAEVNPELAAQLNGKVTGTVKFEGDTRTLRSFDADLVMPGGGKMSASLFAALTQYLPQSREKKRLDLLILKGGKVGMEVFAFTLKGGASGKFAGEIHLKSREINLDLNLTHEINTDGTIASLGAYWERFLK